MHFSVLNIDANRPYISYFVNITVANDIFKENRYKFNLLLQGEFLCIWIWYSWFGASLN